MPGIIHRSQAAKATVLSLADIERDAAFLISTAEADARRIMERAEARARTVESERAAEASRRGFAAGRAEGAAQALKESRDTALKEARDRLKNLADALAAAAREYDTAKHHLLTAAETGMITLAVAIARRVCKTQAVASSEVAIANARALLELVRHEGDMELHLNPAQCDALAESVEDAARKIGQARHVRIVADPTITPGGCRLVAGHGQLDARLETQLDRIAACLCGNPDKPDSQTGVSA